MDLHMTPISIEYSDKPRDLLYINLIYLDKFLIDKTPD